jgi:hypothetical protein
LEARSITNKPTIISLGKLPVKKRMGPKSRYRK